MVSFYSVMRYVPRVVAEEFVNIGVLVATEDGSYKGGLFTKHLGRASRFGGEDTRFLRDHCRLLELDMPNPDQLLLLHNDWKNSIQFSRPRASAAPDPAALLERLFDQYVIGGR